MVNVGDISHASTLRLSVEMPIEDLKKLIHCHSRHPSLLMVNVVLFHVDVVDR